MVAASAHRESPWQFGIKSGERIERRLLLENIPLLTSLGDSDELGIQYKSAIQLLDTARNRLKGEF